MLVEKKCQDLKALEKKQKKKNELVERGKLRCHCILTFVISSLQAVSRSPHTIDS